MKIASSLCLALALFSPASALRGTQKRRLDLEERKYGYDETAPLEAPAPAEPVEEPVEQVAAEVEPVEVTTVEAFDANMPPLRVEKPTPSPTPIPVEGVKVEPLEEAEGWTVDNWAMFSDAARKGKSNKSGNSKNSKSMDGGSGVDPDPLCNDFCQRYMATCEGANVFFDPDEPRGSPARRLIAGQQMETSRLGGSVFKSLDDCLDACVDYPRPTNPADYLDPEVLGVNSIGDTFWCRDTHLRIAERTLTTHFGAQTHCPFAAPSGGGLCTNVPIDSQIQSGYNASAYEFVRAGAETSRHLGYCQMYFNDLVADCTSAGLDDRTLPLALALLPLDTEIIILNNNVGKRDPVTGNTIGDGITTLPSQVFRGLMCPSCILGLIVDDGNVASLASDSFTALRNIQSLSLNMQLIDTIPVGMLDNAPALREFSMYNTGDKPGRLMDGSVPATLFQNRATEIRRIVISGHRGLTTVPAALFANLFDLAVLILSNNGFTNNGINPLMFQSLISLQIFDMSNNQFTMFPKEWFNTGWGWSLTTVYLQSNPSIEIEEGIFDEFAFGCMLEVVLLHDTDLISIPVGLFDFCESTLISYTISPRA